MAGMAQSAVDSLLGRLSALLVDEAQLLRGVRGDVRFIRDEMESMNSLLAHLTEAQHRAHHVRTWMKQVVGLARDSEAYVELFALHVGDARAGAGLLGFLRRMLRLLQTVPVRHRIATQIREIKVRVHQVGKRRLRYGVTVPSEKGQALTPFDDDNDDGNIDQLRTPSWGRDIWARSLLELDGEVLFKEEVDRIVLYHILPQQPPSSSLKQEEPGSRARFYVRTFQIKWSYKDVDNALVARLARAVYDHPSLSTSFHIKVKVHVGNLNEPHDPYYSYHLEPILREVLAQVAPAQAPQVGGRLHEENDSIRTKLLSEQIQGHLRGQRFLILLEQVYDHRATEVLISSLLGPDGVASEHVPGSTIIITCKELLSSEHYITLKPRGYIYEAIYNKAELITYTGKKHVQEILDLCYPDAFAMKMFLHFLQANSQQETALQIIRSSISECKSLNKSISKQMLIFCYNELPSKYKGSLMYLSIFPEDRVITRTSLARRWIAEGIINPTRQYYTNTEEGRLDSTTTLLEDVAKHYFEMLVAWGFIHPVELSDACNIKTCTVHPETSKFIARIATDVNFVDTGNLPQGLAQHLSIHNRIPLQASYYPMDSAATGDGIVESLPYLAKSSQWKLLKVLDLEGCRGLKKKHLKIICNILLLRYFSLRNTDVTELPKQIEKLTCLETLDIRETAVREFATKSIMLPMLKHILAGQSQTYHPPPSNNSDSRFQESFMAVRLPTDIQRMKKIEVLSHVQVSHNAANDMVGISQLLRLRKLGVILHRKKRDGLLDLLFQQIEKLHDCLRSLSIIQSVDTSGDIIHDEDNEVHPLALPPKLLRRLKIRGISNMLPRWGWVAELDQLVKLTLSETYLGKDDLGMIGNLKVLACLRLLHKSYNESKLQIKKGEFKCLKSLIVQGTEVTNIHIGKYSSPRLEMIMWSFAKMEAMDGLSVLPSLKKVQLNGDCNPDPVKNQLRQSQSLSQPYLKHNGRCIV